MSRYSGSFICKETISSVQKSHQLFYFLTSQLSINCSTILYSSDYFTSPTQSLFALVTPERGDEPKTGDTHCRILPSVRRRNTSQRYRREAPLVQKLPKVRRSAYKKPLSGPGPSSVRSVLRSLSPPE